MKQNIIDENDGAYALPKYTPVTCGADAPIDPGARFFATTAYPDSNKEVVLHTAPTKRALNRGLQDDRKCGCQHVHIIDADKVSETYYNFVRNHYGTRKAVQPCC